LIRNHQDIAIHRHLISNHQNNYRHRYHVDRSYQHLLRTHQRLNWESVRVHVITPQHTDVIHDKLRWSRKIIITLSFKCVSIYFILAIYSIHFQFICTLINGNHPYPILNLFSQ
jgi:hypothetical protein